MEDLTDWEALRAMTDEDIERAAASDPDAPMMTDADWANARVVWPAGKEPGTIRIDKDIVEWFRKRGRGYQSKINAVLRAYIEAPKGSSKSSVRRTVQKRRRA